MSAYTCSLKSKWSYGLLSCAIKFSRDCDVAKNAVSQVRVEGNAWDLVADSGGVEFIYTIMDGEPGGRVSLEIYRRALETWRDFLADESCDDRIVEISD
jgi:hypothetical protein